MAESQDMCQLLNSEISRINNELHSSELGRRKAIAYGQTYPGGNGFAILEEIKKWESDMNQRLFDLNAQKIQNHCN